MMGGWFSSHQQPRSMLFKNAQLVGYPDGTYDVLVEGGVVKQISRERLRASGGAEVVDMNDKWLAPVSHLGLPFLVLSFMNGCLWS